MWGRATATVIIALHLAQVAQCTIDAYINGTLYSELDDVPAVRSFGPSIPKEGITGRLRLGTPDMFGCTPLDIEQAPTEEVPATLGEQEHDDSVDGVDYGDRERVRDALPVIVLLSRSLPKDPDACTFEQKVRNAANAGAGLVIVSDYMNEPLFHMQRVDPAGEPLPIPAVLVSFASGQRLRALVGLNNKPEGLLLFVDGLDPYDQLLVSINLSMVVALSSCIVLLLMCGLLLVWHSHRHGRRYEAIMGSQPLSNVQMLQLPEVVVEAGSDLEKESCSVCLEDFKAGEKLQILPCDHCYHPGCIKPWLTERQRTCPLCKEDVTRLADRAGEQNERRRSTVSAEENGTTAIVGTVADSVYVYRVNINATSAIV